LTNAPSLLVHYARYHRDPRNIATHAVGIPLIVLAVGILLARWRFELWGVAFTANTVAWLLASAWYLLRCDTMLALATSAAVGALVALGHPLGDASWEIWMATGTGLFVLGWAWQFVGHFWEGRKPAFLDDLRGLLIGPMFVVAEAGFRLGLGRGLQARIEAEAGPVARREPVRGVRG
jgi:uncharacterized membrane protein YGL010W